MKKNLFAFCLPFLFCFQTPLTIDRIYAKLKSETNVEKITELATILYSVDLVQNIPTGVPLKLNEGRSYNISSPFGYRIHPISKKKKFHNGLDFATRLGTYVIAAADGEIISYNDKLSSNSKLGKYIKIKHENGFETIYGHLSIVVNRFEKKIEKGDIIGMVGSTGHSTGNHLHYIIKKNDIAIDPKPLVNL